MTNTVAQAIAYAENHPTHNGSNWNGWCEALVHNAGGFTNAFTTARLARLASHVYSPSELPLGKVPDGWLLHWEYENFGHIAIMTPHGALMASGFTDSIHPSLGFIDPAKYGAVSGHKYLGASPDHGGQFMAGIQRTPTVPTPSSSDGVSKPGRIVATLATGKPNTAFYKRLQWFAHLNGYTGPIDGVMGVASWKGVQRGLAKSWRYTGPIDGKPGLGTYEALQRLGAASGYSGPIDGKLGSQSYRAIAKKLNTL